LNVTASNDFLETPGKPHLGQLSQRCRVLASLPTLTARHSTSALLFPSFIPQSNRKSSKAAQNRGMVTWDVGDKVTIHTKQTFAPRQ
jgi:hypothetical protein